MPTRLRHHRAPARRGAALVELLVALMLLVVGALALAGALARVARTSTEAGRLERAAERVAARLERGAGGPCAVAAGSESGEGVRESWSVSCDSTARTLSDTARFDGPRGTQSVVAATRRLERR